MLQEAKFESKMNADFNPRLNEKLIMCDTLLPLGDEVHGVALPGQWVMRGPASEGSLMNLHLVERG
jgi:hypothetical protein